MAYAIQYGYRERELPDFGSSPGSAIRRYHSIYAVCNSENGAFGLRSFNLPQSLRNRHFPLPPDSCKLHKGHIQDIENIDQLELLIATYSTEL